MKKPYSTALINCSISQKMITSCPLAFGEVAVKERVKHVLNYKKPTFGMIVIAVAACIITAACLLTNPSSKKLEEISGSFENIDTVFTGDTVTYEAVAGFDQKLLLELSNLHISSEEISKSRDEYRDKTNTFMLRSKNDTNAIFIHFNKDFSEVWINDGVKPSYSYQVLKPKTAQNLYADFCQYIVTDESKADSMYGISMDVLFDTAKEFELVFRAAADSQIPEGTLTTSAEYDIKVIHNGETISYGEYMRDVLGYDYADPDYSLPENTWDDVIYTIESHGVTRIRFELLDAYGTLPAGQYVICKPVTLTTENGETFVYEYQARFAVIDETSSITEL